MPLPIERVGAYVPAAAPGPGRLLGTQAAVWGEFTPDASTRAYRMFPRVAVHAANAWTGEPTAWPDARPRLEEHLRRLDAAGVAYRPLDGPTPWQRGGTGRRRMTSPLTVDIVSRMMHAMASDDGSLPDLDPADLSRLMGDALDASA
jgi:hexosaminidase